MDNGSAWSPATDVYLAWDNAASDLPIAGDWNRDKPDQTGVYRPEPDSIGKWTTAAFGIHQLINFFPGITQST